MKPYSYWFSLFLLFASLLARAQINHLNVEVEIDVHKATMAEVFLIMEEQGNFYFSFDSEILHTDSVLTLKASEETVKSVLQKLLPKGLKYKSVGNHIVIYKDVKAKPKEVKISGYIHDVRTGVPLASATLYDPQNSLMVTTDNEGFYEMTLITEADKTGITISKYGYRQEVIYISNIQQSDLDFKLMKLETPIEGLSAKSIDYESIDDRKIVKLLVPEHVMESSNNLTIFNRVPVQISLWPGMGTSGLINSSSVNRLSLNVLGGYSAGTEGVEVGGLVNINKTDMHGVQVAGLSNMTGRDMKGAQVSSIFNYNGRSFEGAQVSAISNVNMGNMEGVQISCISNINRGEMKGVQLSVVSNFAEKDIDGTQLSVITNIALERINSGQGSLIANYAKHSGGLQFAFFANIVKGRNQGFQNSPHFNYAKYNDAAQLGFLNVSDSSSGVPVGVISIVKHGYHKLEISTNEILATGLSFKTGVERFYNIFEMTVNDEYVFSTYGVGTQIALTEKLNLSLDLKISKASYTGGASWSVDPNLLRFSSGLFWQATKKFGVSVAPVLNYSFTKIPEEGEARQITSNSFYIRNTGVYAEQAWVGARLSLLFF